MSTETETPQEDTPKTEAPKMGSEYVKARGESPINWAVAINAFANVFAFEALPREAPEKQDGAVIGEYIGHKTAMVVETLKLFERLVVATEDIATANRRMIRHLDEAEAQAAAPAYDPCDPSTWHKGEPVVMDAPDPDPEV